MLGLNPSMRFYLCEGPVDMRKGIFTLAELVRKIMGKEPSTGDIFIFLSKDRRNIKILHHDTGHSLLNVALAAVSLAFLSSAFFN